MRVNVRDVFATSLQGPRGRTYVAPLSLEAIVAHELGHAVGRVRDVGLLQLDNIEARKNPIMKELGRPARTTYESMGLLGHTGWGRKF